MELKTINEEISVSGQILPAELTEISAAGFKSIINNRPDGESTDQPSNRELERAARALGLEWHYLPVTMQSMNSEDASVMAQLMELSDHPVLAFCRSGRRSSLLYLLSLSPGKSLDELLELARTAGLDTEGLREFLSVRRVK